MTFVDSSPLGCGIGSLAEYHLAKQVGIETAELCFG